MMLLYESAASRWDRCAGVAARGGFALASMGTFLVMSSAPTPRRAARKPLARLAAVLSDRCKRKPGESPRAREAMGQGRGPAETRPCRRAVGRDRHRTPPPPRSAHSSPQHQDIAVAPPAPTSGMGSSRSFR